jgi:hypothetical protein
MGSGFLLRRSMDEEHADRLAAARMRSLVARTGVAVLELAVLLSAFEAVVGDLRAVERGDIPHEELLGVPDPAELLAKEADVTTREALEILRRFLDMSAEGEARLRDLLSLEIPDDE